MRWFLLVFSFPIVIIFLLTVHYNVCYNAPTYQGNEVFYFNQFIQ